MRSRPKRSRAGLYGAVRIAITGVLLLMLATRIDVGYALSLVKNVSIAHLIAAVITLLAAVAVSAVRWHVILATEQRSPGITPLLKLALAGLFFNQLLPSGIGGDAVRAWRCRGFGVELSTAIRSVVLDRISGYLVLVVLYAATMPVLLQRLPDAQQKELILALFILSVAAVAGCGLIDLLPLQAQRIPGFGALAELSRTARQLLGRPIRAGVILTLSAVATILTTLACALVGRGIGADVSFGSWLMIIAPITVLQLVPLTVAGWGVREIGLVSLLPVFGSSAETALATSLLIGLSMIAAGMPGGVIWLAGLDLPRAKPAVHEKAAAR